MQTNDTTTNTGADQLDDGRTIEGGIKVVAEPDNALVVLDPPRFATELFKPFNDDLASAKRKRIRYDITTKEGMAQAKEVLANLVKIRTGAEKAKTKAKRPIDLAGKEILAQYNTLETACKAEEKKHADAIAEENARIARIEEEKRQLERVRIEAIEGRIEDIRLIPVTLAKADSSTIAATLDELVARVLKPEDFQEHLEVAIGAQNIAINDVRQLLVETRDRENKDAELARLRAEDERRRADAAETQRKADEAAAALKSQQDQMAAIMEMNNLANTLTDAGKDQDRTAIEAALAKLEAFDPAAFGAMAPMATLARDAAKPLLLDLLANLPAPAPAPDPFEPEAPYVDPDIDQQPAVAPVVEARVVAASGVRFGLPAMKQRKPADIDLLELVAHHYDVSNETAISWLATFDADAVRAVLAGS